MHYFHDVPRVCSPKNYLCMDERKQDATMRDVDDHVRSTLYRDCASITIQVAELREEVKDCIAHLVKGFHALVQSILQHRTEKAIRADATLKDISAQLSSLREFVGSWSNEGGPAKGVSPAADESPLVHQLHASVVQLCSRSTWENLHRCGDFSASAPFSWNTCDNLRSAVPHAINALNACCANIQRLDGSNQMLSLRQATQERKIQCLEEELQLIKTELRLIVEQSSREHRKTAVVDLDRHAEESVGSLLRALRSNLSSLPTLPTGRCEPGKAARQIRVEVVQAEPKQATNQFLAASLRSQNAKLRFRLAVCLVTKDLVKFRCRRSLCVSAFHYRALRIRLQEALHRASQLEADVRQLRTNGSAQASHGSIRNPTGGELTEVWRTALHATPPAGRARSAKPRAFQQYVEGLVAHGISQASDQISQVRVARVVTSPRQV